MLTPQEKLQKLQELKDPSLKINRIFADKSIAEAMLKMNTLQGIAGQDGKTPIKGSDYFTENEVSSIISRVQALIQPGEKGDKGEIGIRGPAGESPIRGIHYWTSVDQERIIKDTISRLPKPKDGITPNMDDIVSQVVSEINKKPIEFKDIKGTETLVAFLKSGGFRGGGISNITGLILPGTNITLTGSGTQNDPYTINASGGGGGTPGGLNTQLQYNNAGTFGGVSGAVTDGTILSLTNPLLGGATLTTSSVNGVTLSNGGIATTYLDGTGSYSTPAGAISSVSNADGSLTISPTTGAVVGSLNTTNANTWTGVQTFADSKLILAGGSTGTTTLTYASSTTGGGTYTFPATSVALTVANLQQAQTFTGAITASNSFSVTSSAVNVGSFAGAATYQFGSGATTSGLTKTLSFGANGLSGSTTNISLGSTVSGSLGTTTVNSPNFTVTGTTTLATSLSGLLKASSGVISVATAGTDYLATVNSDSTLTGTGATGSPLGINLTSANTWTGATTFSNTLTVNNTFTAAANTTLSNGTGNPLVQIGTGAILSGNTKTINLGTGGVSGSTTAINIGSANGTTVTVNSLGSGLVKSTSGVLSNATAGTDYIASVNVNSTLSGAGTTASALGINLSNANTWTALQTFNSNGLGTSTTDGILVDNTTAAALGAQQISPSIHLMGNGWGTTAGTSQSIDYRINVLPVQAAVASGSLQFLAATNGGAYTAVATISSGGILSTPAGLTTGGGFTSSAAPGALSIMSTISATTANFFTSASSIIASSVASTLWGAVGTTYTRTIIGSGSATGTLGAGANYGAAIVGSSPITAATSGTNPWATNLAVLKMGTYTAGTGTVANTASLYIDGAQTFGTTANYALYVNSGLTSLQGGLTVVGTTTLATTLTGILQTNSGVVSTITVGSGLTFSGGTLSATGGGSGTVTSVTSPNGTISVATGTTTPAIDIDLTHTNVWTGSQTFTDNAFTVQDDIDNTKKAMFTISGITTGTTNMYGLPNATGTLVTLANIAQTFTGAITVSNTFTTNAITSTLGTGTGSLTANVGIGSTISGNTKTVNLGTGGSSGSITNINISSATSGALGTLQINTPTINVATLNAGGLVKATVTTGALSIASAGTDYLAPTGSGSGLSGVVLSVVGTTNRITSTGGQNPAIDISATFEALLGKVGNPLSQFAATTSAQLAGIISDETGSGALVFGTSPTLTTSLLMSSGFSMNWNASNVVLTHSSGVLTLSTGDLQITTAGSNTASVVTVGGTTTLTGKRITKRTGTVASSSTPTINTDTVDFYSITALAAAITSFTTNLSGTPTEAQTLWIAITDNGTARALAWGTSFEASTVPLPTTTVISTRLDVGFVWNTVTSKWRCVSTA